MNGLNFFLAGLLIFAITMYIVARIDNRKHHIK